MRGGDRGRERQREKENTELCIPWRTCRDQWTTLRKSMDDLEICLTLLSIVLINIMAKKQLGEFI